MHARGNLVSKQDPKFSLLKIRFSSTVQRLSNFQEIQENLLQWLSTFQEIRENLSMAASIQKIAIRALYFSQNCDIPQ